ncbi:hypothetical protein GCK72_022521 [Caenorhabditis remanei]|uniref:Uncharacterized protein n=1 Tax=Caenorhabditis remanei TaxID=31234 RepID=A0A6A5FUB7_CAERE|nr:hypothetical protein GCK72_022521 [Caenorhabditis remanei]KAF1746069.1 hypothetical protein GCK72_022521 [Caenorhabditis remanei]
MKSYRNSKSGVNRVSSNIERGSASEGRHQTSVFRSKKGVDILAEDFQHCGFSTTSWSSVKHDVERVFLKMEPGLHTITDECLIPRQLNRSRSRQANRIQMVNLLRRRKEHSGHV